MTFAFEPVEVATFFCHDMSLINRMLRRSGMTSRPRGCAIELMGHGVVEHDDLGGAGFKWSSGGGGGDECVDSEWTDVR
eukprot:m.62060 g.62060  ORF g.62060 m.62060 type:complete len:79 (-) comp17643_c1_seq1:369-605(-)